MSHAKMAAPTWPRRSSDGNTRQNETASASSPRRSGTLAIRPGSESDPLPARPGLRRVRSVGSELGGARFAVILVSRLLSPDCRKPVGLADTLASWATSTKQRSYVAVLGAEPPWDVPIDVKWEIELAGRWRAWRRFLGRCSA